MALRVRQTASVWLGVLLMGSVLALVLFAALFVTSRDWLAAALAAVAGVSAVRLATRILQLVLAARAEARGSAADLGGAPSPSGAEASQPVARTPSEQAFVSRATHGAGARFREGYVVMGRDAAAFVPTSGWRHLAAEVVMGLLAQRVSLTTLELDAEDSPDFALELAALVKQREGFYLDEHWSWARRGLALARLESQDYLRLDRPPPPAFVANWPVLPVDPTARRRVARKVAGGAAVVCALLAAAGALTWRVTGNSDFLIAGLCWAGLIGGAVAAGLILGRKVESSG